MARTIYRNNPDHHSIFSPITRPANALKLHVQHIGKITLPVADLVFLQAVSNYCWLHWTDGQRMLSPRTLKYYEPQLPATWFVRPHRNCIINVRYIERLEQCYPDRSGLIHLRSGDVLPVSRRRWVAVKKFFQNLPQTDHSAISSTA